VQTARLAQAFEQLSSAFSARVTLAQSHVRSGCFGVVETGGWLKQAKMVETGGRESVKNKTRQ